jgi:hypothetical protein
MGIFPFYSNRLAVYLIIIMKKSIVPSPNVDLCHLSTVTPCHGRPELIERLLISLLGEKMREKDLKIDFYLVDSTPEASPDAQAIFKTCLQYGAHYMRGDRSVRKKRNQGVKAAIENGANIILFIDSDCEAQAGLFSEHLKAYKLPYSPWSQRPVGGATGITRFVGDRSNAYRAVEKTRFLDGFLFPLKMPEAPWAPCTNFSVRASLFEEIGGFLENWDFKLGGDDTEIGRRINNAGYAIVCCSEAYVHHVTSTWNSWRAIIERIWRWGCMDVLIRQNEPVKHLFWKSPQPLNAGFILAPFTLLLGPISFAVYIFCIILISPMILALLRYRPYEPFLPLFQAELLEYVFQAGNFYKAVFLMKPSLAFKEIITHPMQIGISWEIRRREAWAVIGIGCAWILITNIIIFLLPIISK